MQIAVQDDASYILLRLRQTHDIWHLITGFGTDVAGELGLKAFELAQTRRPMALVLLTFGLLKALIKTPDALATPIANHFTRLPTRSQCPSPFWLRSGKTNGKSPYKTGDKS